MKKKFFFIICVILFFSCNLPQQNNESSSGSNKRGNNNKDGNHTSYSSNYKFPAPLSRLTSRSDVLSMTTGKTYYLDANDGDDQYEKNTSSTPWKTLARVQSELQGGEAVILRSGNYGVFEDTTVRTDWVTYIADIGASVVFDEISLRENWEGSYYSLKLRFWGIIIIPFDVDPASSGNPGADDPQCPYSDHYTYAKTETPVDLKSISDVEFYNCEVYNKRSKFLTSTGIHFAYSRNIWIEGCNIHDVRSGIYFAECSDSHIYYNHIYNLAATFVGDSGNSDNMIIEGNYCHSRIWYITDDYYPRQGEPYHGSGVTIRSSNFTVRNNIFRNLGGTSGMMLYGDHTCPSEYNNILFENNLLYDINVYQILRIYNLGNNIIYRNNTVVGRYRYVSDGFLKGGKQYYTAFAVHSVADGHDGSGLKLYNNIFVGTVALGDALNTADVKNNICWSVESSNVFYDKTEIGESNKIITTVDYNKNFENNYFEIDFFREFNVSWPLMETYWDPDVIAQYPNSGGHDKVIDYSLAQGSEAIGFGNSKYQPNNSLGSLSSSGFININGISRNTNHHSVGCYEY